MKEPGSGRMEEPNETGTDGFRVRQERSAAKHHSIGLPEFPERREPSQGKERPQPGGKPRELPFFRMRRKHLPVDLGKPLEEIFPEDFITRIRDAVIADKEVLHEKRIKN